MISPSGPQVPLIVYKHFKKKVNLFSFVTRSSFCNWAKSWQRSEHSDHKSV